ncbi:hypothetical protein PAECIP112173_00386 [Paenibacillus sp. JJ-100]|uniref:hypothetical protein n=1 Tax=Paenibacillus sp. JJ-100 TaxID=2974896 RepID=UPI0022FFA1A8|nr:hypothetical protein [Paenibacillus sp. JJ-100]CAI6024516.1 hypothetical protein PAECIP112173_00386 [Paenibacillus sp. JJ-100]
MQGRLIKNDAEYERARVALLEMAARLDDPLKDMEPDERIKTHKIYDRTADLMKYYSRGRDVEREPRLRGQYEAAGWAYQDFSSPADTPRMSPETKTSPKTEEAAKQTPEPPKTASKVSSWLDD